MTQYQKPICQVPLSSVICPPMKKCGTSTTRNITNNPFGVDEMAHFFNGGQIPDENST
jgi:hypothetical protein